MSDTPSAPISHLNVWPVGDELVVTWRGGGPAINVFVSDDPIDAGTDVRAPDGPNQVTVPRREQTYVHLFDPEHGFTVVGERLLAMDGVMNFRDLGGYPTVDGGATRWGQVFRSARLNETSDADLDRIERLGITKVFDLRTQAEVDNEPDRLPDSVEHVHLPMSSSVALQKGLFERILDRDMTSFTKADMAEGYVRMLESFPEHLGQMAHAVADGEKILFHCTAGKDRTGITAMLLLGLAEVGDGHVLDDYEISARHQPEGRIDAFTKMLTDEGIDPDPFDLDAMLGSPRPVMRMTIDSLRDRWGGVEGYADFLGLDAGRRAAARANLRFAQP
ncbi:MAG: tyrosine-protein phosphatase [Acidimicrobiaceae bacterium]|nr:tyrosine-protein phosphatase [Acidimicrobiales bacterium]